MKRKILLSTIIRCLPPISAHCTSFDRCFGQVPDERVGRLVVVVVGVEDVEIDGTHGTSGQPTEN